MPNNSYEKRILAMLRLSQPKAHLRVRVQRKRHPQADVPMISFEPPVVTWRWPYFFGALAVSSAMYFAVIWSAYELSRSTVAFVVGLVLFTILILGVFAPVLVGLCIAFEPKKQTRTLELFK